MNRTARAGVVVVVLGGMALLAPAAWADGSPNTSTNDRGYACAADGACTWPDGSAVAGKDRCGIACGELPTSGDVQAQNAADRAGLTLEQWYAQQSTALSPAPTGNPSWDSTTNTVKHGDKCGCKNPLPGYTPNRPPGVTPQVADPTPESHSESTYTVDPEFIGGSVPKYGTEGLPTPKATPTSTAYVAPVVRRTDSIAPVIAPPAALTSAAPTAAATALASTGASVPVALAVGGGAALVAAGALVVLAVRRRGRMH